MRHIALSFHELLSPAPMGFVSSYSKAESTQEAVREKSSYVYSQCETLYTETLQLLTRKKRGGENTYTQTHIHKEK